MHAIVPAERDDSRLEGERGLLLGLLIVLRNQHRTYFCPDRENSVSLRYCCAVPRLTGGDSPERGLDFSAALPTPTTPPIFAPDFLASEEGPLSWGHEFPSAPPVTLANESSAVLC